MIKKKIHRKLPKNNNLPSPALALLGLIPVFLFGYLLLSIIAEKTVEYQESETAPHPYTPAYYPLPEPSYRQPAQIQQIRPEQYVAADIERANLDAQEQTQRLKLQREQLKTQRTFYPF
ncbi:MAG: hypothetical protein AUJ74_00540 [Candidatus Omnitrophica bacterium CG1_02_44_16]|nr:MAG: hypothetical protein AUJ74_00540 [Candidatus Omnitrophica bacterium CG1_02_44_16]PIY83325.1 MAG: hypothetical protein COY78_02680 [Candidatus Omnitrophica bacterium CG_4_10_14_0_8_um_filter_44_12]PIZ84554.1 MAG: hypothetical protein COX96_03480 [Candidatus Omnitrophica bacterium CG_4_10_14_0_2_um_filter_44_9]